MSYPAITKAIGELDVWCLYTAPCRHESNDIWVAFIPRDAISSFDLILDGDHHQLTSFYEYACGDQRSIKQATKLNPTEGWLPIVSGNSLEEAMWVLEYRVAQAMSEAQDGTLLDNKWLSSVLDFYQTIENRACEDDYASSFSGLSPLPQKYCDLS